jgi:hypothetical protein
VGVSAHTAPILLTVGPLIAGFRATLHAIVDQPNYPNVNHVTPWTGLAPKLGGHGSRLAVAGGPGRAISLLLAIALGVWAGRRWRDRPELLAWSCAAVLALRCYTEAVMVPYYAWPALAVGLVVAARGSPRRFAVAIALAIFTTVAAQWHLRWFPWWVLDLAGVTGLLIIAWPPAHLESTERRRGSRPAQIPGMGQVRHGSVAVKTTKKKEQTARTNRK